MYTAEALQMSVRLYKPGELKAKFLECAFVPIPEVAGHYFINVDCW